MKKFKFIMPLLAFVVAITVAFAVPTEVETSSNVDASNLLTVPAQTPPSADCRDCGQTQEDNCSTMNTGEPCTCRIEPDQFQAREAGEGNCNNVLKLPNSGE